MLFSASTFLKMQINATVLLSLFSIALGAQRSFAAPSSVLFDLDGDRVLNEQLPAKIFEHMGQYSPRYAVRSDIALPPLGCTIDTVSSIERHGARHFTASALKAASATLKTLKTALASATNVPAELQFIANATLQTDVASLVPYGALQAYYSGRSTATVYPLLAKQGAFVRSSGDEDIQDDRVILTAKYWRLGFESKPFPAGLLATSADVRSAPGLTAPDVVFSEKAGQNNTLDVSTCAAEDAIPDALGEKGAQQAYGASTLLPTIGARLQTVLADAGAAPIKLTATDLINIGNLCSFETLGRISVLDGKIQLEGGKISPWCGIFKDDEWELYGYTLDVGKWTGAGYGNPFYRALGQGYLREVLARFNSVAPILDPPTSLNATIDGNPANFPLPPAKKIFFDGSHDNNVGPIAAAFGLFDGPAPQTTSHAEQAPHAWVFSRIAPLQGKIVFEKLSCASLSGKKAYVRVRANGAIQSARNATWCPKTDTYALAGLCSLDSVQQRLAFVNTDEEWRKCDA